MDGSVHNRSELIDTQAYLQRKASSVLHLRSMHFALVPGGVWRLVHRWAIKNGTHSEFNTVHKLKASLGQNAEYNISEAPARAVI